MARRLVASFPSTWSALLKAPWLDRLVYEEARPEDPPGKAWYAYINPDWLTPEFDRSSTPYHYKGAYYAYGRSPIPLFRCLREIYWPYVRPNAAALAALEESTSSTTPSAFY
jgi:hypothetical protein